MNILFILDFYPPYIRGGAEVSTSLLVNSLNKQNRCMVITSRVTGSEWKWKGVRVLPLLMRADLGDRRITDILVFGLVSLVSPAINSIRLVKKLKNESFDVINYVLTSHSMPPVIAVLSMFRREKIIIDIRDVSLICVSDLSYEGYEETNQKHNCYRHLNKMYTHDSVLVKILMPIFGIYEIALFKFYVYILKKFVSHKKNIRMVALSEYIKDKLVQNGFIEDKIVVIKNIAQHPIKKPKTRSIFDYDFAHAGRLDKRKGIWDLLYAYEKMQDNGLKLAIAGNGTEYEKIKEYIKNRGLFNVKILGRLTPDEVLALYSKSKFIVAPVKSPEGFGRFIQESIATGTPVIATKWGGIPEGIVNNVTGFLVNPNDIEAFSHTMKKAAAMSRIRLDSMRTSIINSWEEYSESVISEKRMLVYEDMK